MISGRSRSRENSSRKRGGQRQDRVVQDALQDRHKGQGPREPQQGQGDNQEHRDRHGPDKVLEERRRAHDRAQQAQGHQDWNVCRLRRYEI